jgi:nudix-type nucleoside diphosphatase (YffH/AdpP family)
MSEEVWPMGPTVVSRRVLHEGWGKLLELTIRLPGGAEIKREVGDHGSAAAVLPYDAERRTALLVRQFRAPPFYEAREANVLEALAGMLDGDDPTDCARREAWEEAGLRLDRLEPVASVWTSPGVSTERIHLFLAPYSGESRTGPGGGLSDEHEDITVVEVGLSDLAAQSDEGGIVDMKTLALVQALRLRRPELFR